MITTAWGPAELVEEISVPQSNDDKEFVSHIQLLEGGAGEPLLRFAYSTEDVARRGPVTLRIADVKRLGKGLEKTPKLRALLLLMTAPKRASKPPKD